MTEISEEHHQPLKEDLQQTPSSVHQSDESVSGSIPITYGERSCTDVLCLYVGFGFSIAIIVFSVFSMQQDILLKSSFPADSDGRLCGIGEGSQYPFLYPSNPPQISERICVKSCPNGQEDELQCLGGCKDSVKIYESQAEVWLNGFSQVGKFCWPTDPILKQNVIESTELGAPLLFSKSLKQIGILIAIAVGLSFLYCIFLQFLPRAMNIAVIVLGLATTLTVAICIYLQFAQSLKKWIICGFLVLIFLTGVINSIRYRLPLRIHGVFLKAASHSLLQGKCLSIFYVPLFIILMFGFGFLMLFEYKALAGWDEINFNQQQHLFWEFSSRGDRLFDIILLVQGLWGLNFLKQAFNFCISANAVTWYFGKSRSCLHGFKCLIFKHLGSAIGGSFITSFLTPLDYLFDFMKPGKKADQLSISFKIFMVLCGGCYKLFDLVHSDALSYICITGIPFCNAARYCEYLQQRTLVTESSQSVTRTYRLCAHFLVASINGLIYLYAMGPASPIWLACVMGITMFFSTFFISLHADTADAILIAFIQEEEFKKREEETNVHNKGFDRFEISNLGKLPFLHPDLVQELSQIASEFEQTHENAPSNNQEPVEEKDKQDQSNHSSQKDDKGLE